MNKPDLCKLRPADLRRIAARAQEPERERKMLALAEALEEREAPQLGKSSRTALIGLRRDKIMAYHPRR
jgi:hypothetical protein